MNKILIVILLSAIVGFSLGRFTSAPKSLDEQSEVSFSTDSSQELGPFSELQFSEYLKLKSNKEKYDKANEILAKIMKIFLADLGMKAATGGAKDYLAESQKVLEQKVAGSKTGHSQSSSFPAAEARSRAAQESSTSSEAANKWRSNEGKVEDVYSEGEVNKFLREVEIVNLFDELKASGELNRRQIEPIVGDFVGQVVFDDSKEQPWFVEMSIAGNFNNNEFSGKTAIRLAKDGKVFSNSRGRGGLNNFKAFSGATKAVLIDAGAGGKVFSALLLSKNKSVYWKLLSTKISWCI